MSDVKFPLCESVGLSVRFKEPRFGADISNIYASDVESLLSRGVRVYAYTGPASRPGGMWIVEGTQDRDSDKQALLIDIKPIARERSARLTESQVRDVMIGVHEDYRELMIKRLFKEADGE